MATLPAAGSSFLELADLVADLRGFLVRLVSDGLVQLLAKLNQFALRLLGLRQSPRRLTGVAGLAVDVFQQWQQFVSEFLVIVGATEPSGIPKLEQT